MTLSRHALPRLAGLLLAVLLSVHANAAGLDPRATTLPGGVLYRWFEGSWDRLPDPGHLTQAGFGVAPGFDLGVIPATRDYAVRFEGYLDIGQAGEHGFYTSSDDGSRLYIDGLPVVDNDGLHGAQTRWGAISLEPGPHRIEVDYLQRGGDQVLGVGYRTPDGATMAIPLERLSYDPGELPAPREPDPPSGLLYPGLSYEYFEGAWSALPNVDALTPVLRSTAPVFGHDRRLRDDDYAFRHQGYLLVPEDGLYTFHVTSADGSALFIGDRKIVDNDGLHPPRERRGSIPLKAGPHRVTVLSFEAESSDTLLVEWSGPSLARSAIPPDALVYTGNMLPPLRPPDVPQGPLASGLAYRYYEGDWTRLPDFAEFPIRALGTVPSFGLGAAERDQLYGFSFSGYIRIPGDGVYHFHVTSDDGSRLWIGDTLVVDNDGLHESERTQGSLALAAGLHAIRLDYFQSGNDARLTVEYQAPDGTLGVIPAANLFHDASQLPELLEPVTPPPRLGAGLAYAYYEGLWNSTTAMLASTPLARGRVEGFSLAPRRAANPNGDNAFGFVYDGFIDIPEDGFYTFSLESDDGSRLWIGDREIVDNDGLHGSQTRSGSIGLKRGLHPIRVAYFDNWWDQVLRVAYRTPAGFTGEIPGSALFHDPSRLPELLPAIELPATARPGLAYRSYGGNWSVLPDFGGLTPTGMGAVTHFSLETAAATEQYGFRFEGYLLIPREGTHQFQIGSDDGSRLWIDDRLVTDNDGLHAYREASGFVGLAAGWHRIRVDYFERGGRDALAVAWRPPGGELGPIPDAGLMFDAATLPVLRRPVAARNALLGGIEYAYYEWNSTQALWGTLPDFTRLVPRRTGIIDQFSLAPRLRNDQFAFRFKGYLDIPEYGYYTFSTASDDGSRLYIDDTLVVDNDGLHALRERSGRIGLERGRHAIVVEFFEWRGKEEFSVAYQGPHFGKSAIPAAVLFRLNPANKGNPGIPDEPTGPLSPALNQLPAPVTDELTTGLGAGQAVLARVLANDRDDDGDVLTLTGVTSGGGPGAALFDTLAGTLTYYPPLGFQGTDRLTYSVEDRRGGKADGELVIRVGERSRPVMSAAEAARLLTQASFGPTRAGIAAVMEKGAEAWIDEQLKLPPSLHAPIMESLRRAGETPSQRELRVRAWLDRALFAPDQLRQRVAFALSEILVVSDLGNELRTDTGVAGAVDYYDLLVKGALGSYRQLLGGVTLHPAMGLFLNMAGNRKSDPVLGTVPDENYAREILQLFSLGLWRLNNDGSRLLDDQGQALPTYDTTDVMELARVFTGWNLAAAGGSETYRQPMTLDPSLHDDGEKVLLKTRVIPPGQGGEADLRTALDHIASHPNLAPFLSRLLIQRLVTSNPSPAYVGRVATAFGASQLNLGAAVKALLLDPEARTPPPAEPLPKDGKLREPLLQLSALWRGLGILPASSRVRLDQLAPLGQLPLSAPSVFNFFKPDHAIGGTSADPSILAPELELLDEKQVIAAAGVIDDWTLGGRNHYNLGMELAYARASADHALTHLDTLFMSGRMSGSMRTLLAELMFDGAGLGEGYTDADRLTRMLGAIYLVVTSPEFQTQR